MMNDLELSSEELEALIHKAVEIENRTRSRTAETNSSPLTHKLEEAVSIAAEIGVSERSILLAAAENKLTGNEARIIPFLGSPHSAVALDILQTRCSKDDLNALLEVMPSLLSLPGHGFIQMKRLHWQAASDMSSPIRNGVMFRTDITLGDKHVEICCKEDLRQAAGGIFGGIIGGLGCGVGFGVGFGVGLGALNSPVFSLVFTSTVLCASYILARFSYKKIYAARKRFVTESVRKIRDYLAARSANNRIED